MTSETVPFCSRLRSLTYAYAATLALVVSTLGFPALLAAQCAGPSTSGFRICYPSPRSYVTYPATLEIGATFNGLTIAAIRVYDNNKPIETLGFLPSALSDGGVYNGPHHIVINAWDTNGHLYQAATTFNVVGFGYDLCRATAPGVNICTPSEGQAVPNLSVPITMKANPSGVAKITAWRLYLDDKLVMSSSTDYRDSVDTLIPVSAGNHRLVINAWDSAGKLYQTARRFNAFYEYDCNPKNGACTPGIIIHAPANASPWGAQDVKGPFLFQAEATLNPSPIVNMQLSLDGNVIHTNGGPGIAAELAPSPGSHIVSVQAWDRAGKMYATYSTLNVY